MEKIICIASSALLVCGASAADFSFEGRWTDIAGAAQPNIDSTCELRFYAAQDAASPVTNKTAAFRTDADGYFVVADTSPETLPDVFWVGVKPSGGSEIVPRFRVAPVPYAFAADEANLVESDTELAVEGTVSVGTLAASGDVIADEWLLPDGGTVSAANLQLDNVRLEKLTLDDACFFALFNNGGVVSPDYDRMSRDKSVGAEVKVYRSGVGGFYLHADTQDSRLDTSFADDGFAVFAIKAQPKDCPAPEISITVGNVTFVSSFRVGSDKGNNTVKRCMTVPYRAGEKVSVHVKAVGYPDSVDDWWGGNDDAYKARIDVGLKLVKFGR